MKKFFEVEIVNYQYYTAAQIVGMFSPDNITDDGDYLVMLNTVQFTAQFCKIENGISKRATQENANAVSVWLDEGARQAGKVEYVEYQKV